MKCGCYTKCFGATIVYCPLHAAAPAMLEALKRSCYLTGIITDIQMFTLEHKQHLKSMVPYLEKLNDQIRAAISLAERNG